MLRAQFIGQRLQRHGEKLWPPLGWHRPRMVGSRCRHSFLPMIELNEIGPKYLLSRASSRLSPMTKNWSGGTLTDASGARSSGDDSKATSYDTSPFCSRKTVVPSATYGATTLNQSRMVCLMRSSSSTGMVLMWQMVLRRCTRSRASWMRPLSRIRSSKPSFQF